MCLRCRGCGKCIETISDGANDELELTLDEALVQAGSIGPHVHMVAIKLKEDLKDEGRTLSEIRAILRLGERFSDSQIDSACEYALSVVPKPRKPFLQIILESGRY